MAQKIKNLQELLNKSGIPGEVLNQDVSYLVPPGENFGSIILKVDITLVRDGKKEVLHGVAKCTPRNPLTQALFQTQLTFKNEIYWYDTIIPIFKNFQKECGMEKTADFFQKFYAARISLDPNKDEVDEDGLLLTENLITSGYKVYDRQVGFDYETAKLVLTDLAVFHAVFIAIRKRKPEVFETKIKPSLFCFGESVLPEDAPNPLAKVYARLEKEPELAPFIPRIKKNNEDHSPYANEEIKEGPWTSASHNDFWSNNVMIKDGPPKQAVIIDLQVPRYKSVGADVIFFMLSSLQYDTYQQHYDDLLRQYYDTFVDTLSQAKVDTADYSYEGFLKEIDREAEYGQWTHAFMHNIFTLADKNEDGRKYAGEEGSNMMKEMEEMTGKLNHKHIKKYKFLVSEAVKHNWI